MDISAILISSVQGHPWSASAAIVICVVGYIITHLIPILPVPAPGATGFWAKAYPVLSFIAGNWGNAANLPAKPEGSKP